MEDVPAKHEASDDAMPSFRQALPRILLRVGVVIAFAVGSLMAMDWLQAQADMMEPGEGEAFMVGVYLTMLLVYALLISIPFVPGVEIGLTLLVLRGAVIAPYVWIATVAGLTISYLVGRFLPYDWLHKMLADLRMRRVCDLLERTKPLSREERLARLEDTLPGWLRPVLAGRGRYLLLAVLIALPGNGLIGGGGGISFVAGLSRLFATPWALVTLAVAVLPLPLIVWLYGRAALTGL